MHFLLVRKAGEIIKIKENNHFCYNQGFNGTDVKWALHLILTAVACELMTSLMFEDLIFCIS